MTAKLNISEYVICEYPLMILQFCYEINNFDSSKSQIPINTPHLLD